MRMAGIPYESVQIRTKTGQIPVVFYDTTKDGKLAPELLAIIPYRENGNGKVGVVYSMTSPFVRVGTLGLVDSGILTLARLEKLRLAYDRTRQTPFQQRINDIVGIPEYARKPSDALADEVQKQTEGYLSLLGLTDGRPITIAVVHNDTRFSLEEIADKVANIHRDEFLKEHSDELPAQGKQVAEQTHREKFSLKTWGGLWRAVRRKTTTAYYGVSLELMKEISPS